HMRGARCRDGRCLPLGHSRFCRCSTAFRPPARSFPSSGERPRPRVPPRTSADNDGDEGEGDGGGGGGPRPAPGGLREREAARSTLSQEAAEGRRRHRAEAHPVIATRKGPALCNIDAAAWAKEKRERER